MNKDTGKAEARYEGVNWDSEWKPTARMKCNGDNGPKRKVLTKGVKELALCDTFRVIKSWIRQGYEVRLRDGGDAFLRIFPVLGTDLKTMYAACKSMAPLSGCLADKKARVVFRGREYSNPEDAAAAYDETRHGRGEGWDLDEVTPDTVVECPKCGSRFRVGRSLSNDAA